MELVEIIYSILLISFVFFGFVILISYTISKTRTNNIQEKIRYEQIPIKLNRQTRIENQKTLRNEQVAKIYERAVYSDKIQENSPRSNIIKITNLNHQNLSIEEIEERKKNGKGLRYSIVNDKLKNIKVKAANFYL
ncbi:MAG: hypothetical protein N2321_02345 [Melioribacteraceae bacterium]|nr:hypothetical protein [Melioribacteraceae bacterium]